MACDWKPTRAGDRQTQALAIDRLLGVVTALERLESCSRSLGRTPVPVSQTVTFTVALSPDSRSRISALHGEYVAALFSSSMMALRVLIVSTVADRDSGIAVTRLTQRPHSPKSATIPRTSSATSA